MAAITMDKLAHAIGPFEITEYIGLAMIWGAFAIAAPFRAAGQPVPATG